MKISRWVVKINEKVNLKRIEPISFEHEIQNNQNNDHTISITLVERFIDPKFYAKLKLTPIEAIKFGTKLICMGIESLKKHEYKPSTIEIKGFDECIFFINKILKKEINIDNNSCPRLESLSQLKTFNKDNWSISSGTMRK